MRHVAAVASMLLVVACSAPEGRPDPAPEPSAACGATLGDGARPGGQLAWSSEDEDVFVDSLDDDAPAARVGEAGIRDLDPDLLPPGLWPGGADPIPRLMRRTSSAAAAT